MFIVRKHMIWKLYDLEFIIGQGSFLYHVVREQESQQLGLLTLQQNMVLINSYRGHIEEKVTFH